MEGREGKEGKVKEEREKRRREERIMEGERVRLGRIVKINVPKNKNTYTPVRITHQCAPCIIRVGYLSRKE
jgi:hypothetical protein